jgi:hypothetical protein
MQLHITKKLAEKLKLAPEPIEVQDELFSWRGNYVQGHGQRFVVFMNDATRFVVAINDAKVAKLKKLPELFTHTLRETLISLCVNPEVVERYISDLGEITYAKNADRKKTTQLNKSAEPVWWALHDTSDNLEISLYANKNLLNYGEERYAMPKEKMLEALGRYDLPVRKFRALDLNIRLDLDGNDAFRKLRVPATATFEQLHKWLQKAFEWQNCHLHDFGLFKEWSENYYARPDVELVVESEQYDAYECNPDAKSVAGVRLCDYVPEYTKILYRYDFGDDWHHYIEVENIIEDCDEVLPILISGEGDSPPEDVGGCGGFAEFLEVIADPNHEEYEHLTTWAESQRWKPFDFEKVAGNVQSRYG